MIPSRQVMKLLLIFSIFLCTASASAQMTDSARNYKSDSLLSRGGLQLERFGKGYIRGAVSGLITVLAVWKMTDTSDDFRLGAGYPVVTAIAVGGGLVTIINGVSMVVNAIQSGKNIRASVRVRRIK